ncbi:cobyrinic acid a,c-diamide synthase [Virgibacillus profundi]|uniref:Cobyrinic acid a,c-diamide synthase n=2 Tax=Virgibacillus profundi TaxID=2024555 RepID=A0A2A2IFG1_9BACI|nr:cobyrinic acid a,c-diamide synthase [Virgibacillus profundi]PXY54270.1 MinD/ParA family protein [Virgibacillus profundi]
MMRDQAAVLRRQLQISKEPKQAKTLSFISGKGGVGKSNIALNFSLELINNHKKVLLFDLDVGMGNIDILLGLNAQKTIIDMFNEQLSVHEIIEHGPNNLAYIAGGSGAGSLFNLNQVKMDYFLDQYNELIQMYDYIIFDMGAGATKDSLFFILASDECIVITTPEPTSITDAYGMIKHVINNQPEMPIYVVMNRSNTQKEGLKSLERFKNVIQKFLHINIHMMGILPEDKTVTSAVRRQIPFLLLNEKSAASKAVKQISLFYLTKSQDINHIEATSFVQKLKQYIMAR